jgi:hypothetical protein
MDEDLIIGGWSVADSLAHPTIDHADFVRDIINGWRAIGAAFAP